MAPLEAAVVLATVTAAWFLPAVTAAAAMPAGTYGGAHGDGKAEPASADFVVIGGGTAGCAIATRLCEYLPAASVAILERGAPRNAAEELLVRSPRLVGDAWVEPSVTEAIVTQPNPGLAGRTSTQFTGNTLGGSSSINAGQWTKPALATFNHPKWAFTGPLPPCATVQVT